MDQIIEVMTFIGAAGVSLSVLFLASRVQTLIVCLNRLPEMEGDARRRYDIPTFPKWALYITSLFCCMFFFASLASFKISQEAKESEAFKKTLEQSIR